jgi:GT2 family glycosyltransferase
MMGLQRDSHVKTTIVIVNYRTPDLTLKCVAALGPEQAGLPGLRAIIVDGGSDDGSAEILREGLSGAFSTFCTFLPLSINGGFGWANNQAILRLLQQDDPPDYIHLLNPDTIIQPGAVAALIKALDDHPQRGAVGSRLLEPDGTIAGSAFRFPSLGREFVRGTRFGGIGRLLGVAPIVVWSDAPCRVDWLTGASVMLRAAALRQTGLFDDGFFLYFEEVELMRRMARAGWQMWHIPASQVMHIGGAATGVDQKQSEEDGLKRYPAYWFRSRKRYFALTGGRLTALMAGLAWLAGDALWRVANMLGLGRAKKEIPFERADLLANGLIADQTTGRPAITNWSATPDTPPAWMAAQ